MGCDVWNVSGRFSQRGQGIISARNPAKKMGSKSFLNAAQVNFIDMIIASNHDWHFILKLFT